MPNESRRTFSDGKFVTLFLDTQVGRVITGEKSPF